MPSLIKAGHSLTYENVSLVWTVETLTPLGSDKIFNWPSDAGSDRTIRVNPHSNKHVYTHTAVICVMKESVCLGATWISGLTSDMFAVQQVSLCIATTCEAALLASRKSWTNRLYYAICRIINAKFFFLELNNIIKSRLQTKYRFGRQLGDLRIAIRNWFVPPIPNVRLNCCVAYIRIIMDISLIFQFTPAPH